MPVTEFFCCSYMVVAEQKARKTYDNILRLSDDPDVNDVIRFLREREIVHFQRFGECLRLCKEKMDSTNVYYVNPAFDKVSDSSVASSSTIQWSTR